MSFFSSVSFFSNRALCTSCYCTEIQWCLASDDDNEKNKQTNKQTLCSKLFLGRNSRRSLEWTSRPSPRFFFLPHRSTVATDMHLNRSLLPFLPPILLSADMAESPHVSRSNLRAQHSLTKNNKHIQTIQCLQRPCSRDARLPFFSSGRRPPKLGRRP